MLSNFIICLQAVLPMFIMMAIGMLVRRAGLLNAHEVSRFNRVVFVVCYPCMMFTNLYGADIGDALNPRLIAFAAIFVFATIGVTALIVMKAEKEDRRRGAMIQAVYRSNFVIMGLPVAMNIYGDEDLAVTAMLIAVIVPIYNVMAVLILEFFRKGRPSPLHIIADVLKNPIIVGAIAGLFTVITGLRLPAILEGVVDDLGVCAMTMSLVILGASFSIRSIKDCGWRLPFCVIGRLIAAPAVGLTLAAVIGFRDLEFITLFAMIASPSAIASYTMAESMGSDGELAGNCVIFSSAFSCLTMFLWLFLFKNIGIF